jgi:hypothetical protein
MKEYYTYAYLRKDRTPYYIGKGKNNRAFYKTKSEVKPPKDKSRIILLKQNLTEEEAFSHEIYMIAVFGRKDLGTGILWNRTNGGEGTSGMRHTLEQRKRLSDMMRGVSPKEETREKIRNALLNKKWSEERKKSLKNAMQNSEIRKKQLEGINKYNECKYEITTPNNEKYIIICTITKLCEILPISHTSIKRLISNKKPSIKGYSVVRISPDTNTLDETE